MRSLRLVMAWLFTTFACAASAAPYSMDEVIAVATGAIFNRSGGICQHVSARDCSDRMSAFNSITFGQCEQFRLWPGSQAFYYLQVLAQSKTPEDATQNRTRFDREIVKWGQLTKTNPNCGPEKLDVLNDILLKSYERGKAQIQTGRDVAGQKASSLKQCQDSTQYKLYAMASIIRDANDTIAKSEAYIAREKRVGQTSGVMNVQQMHLAGNLIESSKEGLAQWTPQFRKLGGDLSRVDRLAEKDPCS